MAMVNA